MKEIIVTKKSAGQLIHEAEGQGWNFVTELEAGRGMSASAAKYICPKCLADNRKIPNMTEDKARIASKKAFVFIKKTEAVFKQMAACPCGFRRYHDTPVRDVMEKEEAKFKDSSVKEDVRPNTEEGIEIKDLRPPVLVMEKRTKTQKTRGKRNGKNS